MIGAGYLDVPRALYEAPPAEFFTMLDPNTNLLSRLGAAATYISEYVLKNDEAGTLTFYVPAPNPPTFVNSNGAPLTPLELMNSIMKFDVSQIHSGRLYSIEHSFLQGYFDGQLLGMPIARAKIEAVSPGNGGDAYFLVTAGLADSAWVKLFVDRADLIFEIRQSPTNTIEATFTNLLSQINAVRSAKPINLASANSIIGNATDAIYQGLPKAKLEAVLNNFHLPPQLSDILAVPRNATFQLYAYSPRFAPAFAGDGPIAQVRRNGGLAMRGNLTFANLITVNNAELSVRPKPYDPLGLVIPPALSGKFQGLSATLPGNLSFNNVALEFNSEPAVGQPLLAASGTLAPIRILPFLDIVPRTAGASLTGRVEVARSGTASLSSMFSLSPARIYLPVLDPTKAVYIDGGTATTPFIFSSDPNTNWNARVTFQDYVSLGVGGIELLRYSGASISGSITNKGTQSGSVTVAIDTSNDLTVLPGNANFRRTFRLQGGTGTLTMNSDGTFHLVGKMDRSLTFNLPISGPISIGAGADLEMTQTNLMFGLTSTAFGPFSGGSATGLLTLSFVNPRAIEAAVSGTLTFDPLRVPAIAPVFEIIPVVSTAAKLSGKLANGILTFSGAKLRANGIFNQEINLPEVAVDLNGNFAKEIQIPILNVPVSTVASPSFSMTGATVTLSRTKSAATPSIYSTSLAVTGRFTGGVLTSGGLPFGVTQSSGKATLDTSGVVDIFASLTIPTWPLGKFDLKPSSGASLTATLSPSGLKIGNATLSASGFFDQAISLPEVILDAAGNFGTSVKLGSRTLKIFNYPFSAVAFTMERNGGVFRIRDFGGDLSLSRLQITQLGLVKPIHFWGTISSAFTPDLSFSLPCFRRRRLAWAA